MMNARHQGGARARAIDLYYAALKLQPDGKSYLAIEERELGARVQVALDLELATRNRVTNSNPKTRERIPGPRVSRGWSSAIG